MSDCGVFPRRLAIEEEVTTDTSAADVAGGGARRHVDADEQFNGSGDGRHVALYVCSFSQLAARNCIACDVLHNNVSTPLA